MAGGAGAALRQHPGGMARAKALRRAAAQIPLNLIKVCGANSIYLHHHQLALIN